MAESIGSPQYNKDELTPPNFLNQEFLENILRNAENDKGLKITRLKIIPGTKPGDHFASIMFKAIVSYISNGKETVSRSLVVKTVPVDDGIKKEVLKEMPIFDRETEMYTKVLPEMIRIMESLGDHEEIAPRLLYSSAEPVVLIFEDITKFGYEMHEKFWNFENTIKIVKKLAKFHALSFYMNDKKYANNLHLSNYKGVLISEKSIDKMQMFIDGLASLKEEVETWPGYEKIAEKIEHVRPKFLKALLEVYKPNPEPGFNVLCHGDFNIKNLMYLKNGEDIDKVLFLDFQLSFWTSPAVDLHYVLYEIGNAAVRRRQGEIVMVYHETFTECLKRLCCLKRGPSLLDLNIEMLKYGQIEILLGLCFLPMFYMDPSKMNMDDMTDPTPDTQKRFYDFIYKNPKIKNIMKEILPPLLYKGILE